MSGGSLDYFCFQMESHVGDFKDAELDDLMKDLAELHHEREWFLSGDTGEGDWNEARDKFKRKWFSDVGRAARIEQYLAEFSKEIRGMFGVAVYCKDCANWTQESKKSHYGRCKYVTSCLVHRSDTACDKFEKAGDGE